LQENIATLTSPNNRMTVVYRSDDLSLSNVIFRAIYWSTFENQAPSSGAPRFSLPVSVRSDDDDDDYDDYEYDDEDYFVLWSYPSLQVPKCAKKG